MQSGRDCLAGDGAEVGPGPSSRALAEAYRNIRQVDEGLKILKAASPVVDEGRETVVWELVTVFGTRARYCWRRYRGA